MGNIKKKCQKTCNACDTAPNPNPDIEIIASNISKIALDITEIKDETNNISKIILDNFSSLALEMSKINNKIDKLLKSECRSKDIDSGIFDLPANLIQGKCIAVSKVGKSWNDALTICK